MSLKNRLSLWIRDHLTDRSMAGLRRQVAGLVPDNASVLEIGSANGTLLLENAGRLGQCVGIDLDGAMVAAAEIRRAEAGHDNLRFVENDATELDNCLDFEPDVAVASLMLHEMPWDSAVDTLRAMARTSSQVIIADFIEPPNVLALLLLMLDETIAGHVNRYIAYRRAGGMPARLREAGLTILAEHETSVPVIGIWVCEARS